MKHPLRILALAVIAVPAAVFAAGQCGLVTLPYVGPARLWNVGVVTSDSPLHTSPVDVNGCSVITGDDVTDIDARFVADPFMIERDGQWYLFCEVLDGDTNQGDIGLAVSTDGQNWAWQQIVLDESFHLSYPQVFRHNGEYWMVPESWEAGGVRLYRAVDFPTKWQLERTLFEGPFVDATLVQHEDRWWAFTSPRAKLCDELRLFSTDDLLTGDWIEHPQSPLVEGNPHIARPGGRILQHEGRLFRFAQDGKPIYGSRLWAFEILTLTEDAYAERPSLDVPLLEGDGHGWNGLGMHHIDIHRTTDGGWIGCLDGLQEVYRVGPLTVE